MRTTSDKRWDLPCRYPKRNSIDKQPKNCRSNGIGQKATGWLITAHSLDISTNCVHSGHPFKCRNPSGRTKMTSWHAIITGATGKQSSPNRAAHRGCNEESPSWNRAISHSNSSHPNDIISETHLLFCITYIMRSNKTISELTHCTHSAKTLTTIRSQLN